MRQSTEKIGHVIVKNRRKSDMILCRKEKILTMIAQGFLTKDIADQLQLANTHVIPYLPKILLMQLHL